MVPSYKHYTACNYLFVSEIGFLIPVPYCYPGRIFKKFPRSGKYVDYLSKYAYIHIYVYYIYIYELGL